MSTGMSNSDIDLDEADMRILDPFCGFVYFMTAARMCEILAAEPSHQINEHDFGEEPSCLSPSVSA